jgi:energy-coupling factor transporter transmembrane protein EcfT
VGLVDKEQSISKQTPLHTKDWYIKWISTIGLIIGMVLTSNNIYPLNLYVNIVALVGWIIVAAIWNDRALIILNTVGLSIYVNGVVVYLLK